METKHVAMPLEIYDNGQYLEIHDANGKELVSVCPAKYCEEGDMSEPVAKLIVRACNAYDEHKQLIANLAQIVYTQNGNLHSDINALLAQAYAALAAEGA